MFNVVNSVVLRPLPFAEPQRLVRIWEVTPQGRYFSSSEPNYLDWRQMSPGFEEMAAFTEGALTLTGAGEPRMVRSLYASHTLLPTLGISPVLGRGFLPEEDQPGGNWKVVLLSRAFWEAELGADPEVLGRTLTLNDRPYTVIGVTPLPTVLRGRRDVIVPLAPDPTSGRGNHFLKVVARLAPEVSPQQAASRRAFYTTVLDRVGAGPAALRPHEVGAAVLDQHEGALDVAVRRDLPERRAVGEGHGVFGCRVGSCSLDAQKDP